MALIVPREYGTSNNNVSGPRYSGALRRSLELCGSSPGESESQSTDLHLHRGVQHPDRFEVAGPLVGQPAEAHGVSQTVQAKRGLDELDVGMSIGRRVPDEVRKQAMTLNPSPRPGLTER